MKRTGLTASFLRTFVLLIVIPILLVLSVTLSILRQTMLDQANERMMLAQENVATALETEVEDMELALAHFLLVNQELAFELASQYNLAAPSSQKGYAQQLTQLFNAMLLPRSNIVALHFYMKDGSYFGLKDDLAIDVSSVKEYSWYQDALSSLNHTLVDVTEGPVTYNAETTNVNNRPIFTVSYAPGRQHRYDRVEVVCLYYYPNAVQQIAKYSRQNMGAMLLVGGDGRILFDGSRGKIQLPAAVLQEEQEQFVYAEGGERLSCFVTPVAGTSFRLISAADQGLLLQDFIRAVWVIVLVALFIFVLFGVFSVFFFNGILKPVNLLIGSMRQAREGDLSIQVQPVGKPEMQRLLGSFNKMMQRIDTLMHAVAAEQEEKRRQEVIALQAQINPHFLLNTLNSIHFIANLAKFDSIRDMTDALMQIMRQAFREEGSFYTVADEVQVLKSYILLMKIRYAGSFEETFEVDEDALSCLIPRFTLQPIVENAIVHGFEGKKDSGSLMITIELEGERLILSVLDNGQGMDAETITRALSDTALRDEQRYGIGVSNVCRRIVLHYGSQYGVTFDSDGQSYTRATISLPVRRKEAPHD